MKIIRKLINLKKAFQNCFEIESIIKKNYTIQKHHDLAFNCKNIGIENVSNNESILVSLTTYSKRIYDVYLVIESLLQQSLKPQKIVLWLAEDEFSLNNIPLILKQQQTRGLEIKFCKDIKSYKKLIPSLREYKDYLIITADDDFIFPFDFIENLYNCHLKFPDAVCYYRGARMFFNREKISPYSKWQHIDSEKIPSHLNFAIGAGGVLYPINCFNDIVFDEDLIFKLAPTADDIWFKMMACINGTKYVRVSYDSFNTEFILIDRSQDMALHHINNGLRKNDEQLRALFSFFNLNRESFND